MYLSFHLVASGVATMFHNNHSARRVSGFTIIEVLVVGAIVTVLVSLILPAINNAREGARRSQCGANQVGLVTAMSQHDAARGFLPSLSDQIPRVTAPGTFRASSWFQSILPYLQHNDIYAKLQQNISVGPALPEALCPSGLTAARGIGWLCYGVNTGTTGYPWDGGIGLNSSIRRSFDDIRSRDGLTNTFFTADKLGRTIGSHNDWESWSTPGDGTLGFRQWNVNSWITSANGPHIINRFDLGSVGGDTPARSKHPGGVMMTFFDGRVKFLKEDIPCYLYAHLTTSYSVWTGSTYSGVNSGTAHYNLRSIGCPTTEPFRVKETDY